jgi:hypothetical protein
VAGYADGESGRRQPHLARERLIGDYLLDGDRFTGRRNGSIEVEGSGAEDASGEARFGLCL